ncbi:MAG: hypothetical protein RID59_18590, partial [Hoeflea sp.]
MQNRAYWASGGEEIDAEGMSGVDSGKFPDRLAAHGAMAACLGQTTDIILFPGLDIAKQTSAARGWLRPTSGREHDLQHVKTATGSCCPL